MLTGRNTLNTVALAAVFTVTALTVGCSSSTPESVHAPVPSFTWKPATTQAVGTALRQSQAVGVAADDRAFVLAALGPTGHPLPGGTRVYAVPELFTSGDDGASWRRVTVPGLTALAQQPVAGYAGRLYLLGEASTQSGTELAMWTSADGLHWSRPEAVPEPAPPPPAWGTEVTTTGITAGSGGEEIFVEDATTLDDQSEASVEFLRAAGSGWFSAAASEFLQYGGTWSVLSPDGSGYVFMTNTEDATHGVNEAETYTSPDGTTWTEETSALPVNTANWGIYTGAGNAGTLAVAGWTTSFADGLSGITNIWTQASQPDGEWKSTQALDPGRLPQPGVGPAGTQIINDIVPLGSGFLATGEGASDITAIRSDSFGAVWYSPDGRTWSKQPETPAGFDRVADMWVAAASGTHIVVIGGHSDSSGEVITDLQIWHGVFTP
jgi:hypothetical protein